MSYYDDDDYPPQRGWWSTFVMATSWSVSAAVILLALALGLIIEIHRAGPPALHGDDTVVEVPHGIGVSGIAQTLEEAGVVRNATTFRLAAMLYARGQKLRAGEYDFQSGASTRAILHQIVVGKVVLHPITIPEGWTTAMALERIDSSKVLSGPAPTPPPEGSLLPETYNVERGSARSAVVAQMIEAHDKALTSLWARRAAGLPLRTPQEAVILASIVEKETSLPSERPRVAAVFLNRLRKKMRLETDPTIIYGVCKAEPAKCADGKLVDEKSGETRGIRESELKLDTAYNTYLNYGLPPTPIANPGLASLEAVLNPARSSDLYFVADGAGGHVFSATLAEHQKNVAKWRVIEKTRGG